MQQTIEPTLESVSQAKAQFERTNARMLHLLTFVPDDKLGWTPAPTSKSALRIVAHSALTSRFFARLITDTMPDPMPAPEEFFESLLKDEHNYPNRESVVALVEETAQELLKAYDTIDSTTIESTPNSPFGPMPVKFWMNLAHDHMAGHVGQLEYLQTIWGDLDNHMS